MWSKGDRKTPPKTQLKAFIVVNVPPYLGKGRPLRTEMQPITSDRQPQPVNPRIGRRGSIAQSGVAGMILSGHLRERHLPDRLGRPENGSMSNPFGRAYRNRGAPASPGRGSRGAETTPHHKRLIKDRSALGYATKRRRPEKGVGGQWIVPSDRDGDDINRS